MDHEKVNEFLGRFVSDLAATDAAGSVVIGQRLGLYRALAEGPATPEQFAERTGCHLRYLTEWLRGQAAGGYVSYEPETGQFSLTEEQAFCLADPNGPNVPTAFLISLGMLRAEPRITEAFRTGAGVGWHEHDEDVFVGCDAFYRPGYVAELIPSWIPALDGVEAKLTAGALVADVGCGLGSSSVLLAEAYPRTTVVGSDYHADSIALARKGAAEAGLADRVSFEVATAQTFTGTGYDPGDDVRLPARHGRPARRRQAGAGSAGSGRHVASGGAVRLRQGRGELQPGGTAVLYSASTFLCVPNGLSQPGGYALGAQAVRRRSAR
ncbi:class I SAM-dependent methyltransferase [Nonomuraea dietziae]|uniref:class I SAM-dependent methyltransferase n=1 Tax=Nonomuraea dietziae TaxID=65515 RepID=UPI0031D63BD4